MNIVSSAFGRYEATGTPDEGDFIIGHSFGTSQGEGSPNHAAAQFIAEHANGREVFADQTLADVLPPDVTVGDSEKGEISRTFGGGTGRWGTLQHAKQFMIERGYETALMVGQKYHIGRIGLQAAKLEIPYILPPGLPDVFDPESEQWWTHSLGLWVPREIVGSVYLWTRGRTRLWAPAQAA